MAASTEQQLYVRATGNGNGRINTLTTEKGSSRINVVAWIREMRIICAWGSDKSLQIQVEVNEMEWDGMGIEN